MTFYEYQKHRTISLLFLKKKKRIKTERKKGNYKDWKNILTSLAVVVAIVAIFFVDLKKMQTIPFYRVFLLLFLVLQERERQRERENLFYCMQHSAYISVHKSMWCVHLSMKTFVEPNNSSGYNKRKVTKCATQNAMQVLISFNLKFADVTVTNIHIVIVI